MPAFLTHKQWLAVLLAVFMAVALSACGGGGGGTTMPPDPGPTEPPMPTAYEQAMEAIAAATTAADAQAAYDAVKDQVTAAQGEMLQAAVDARADALAMMAREAEQKQALMDAAGMIDTSDLSTQALVDAARTAIAGLRQAIANAADVSEADKAMYMMQLDNAVDAVDMAQGGIDTETRRMNQMTALSGASTTLQAALAALSGATPTQALLDAANNALMALNTAIMDGADLTDTEKAPYQREADNAAMPIRMAQNTFDKDEADKAAADAAAMAATAARLYAGIHAPAADATGTDVGDVHAAYGTGANEDDIVVTMGDGTTANANTLSEDKDAMVAARHGWEGMMFTAEPEGNAGTYEAVVYSYVGEPTEGAKFNDSANGGYTLNADDQIADVTSVTSYAGLVASTRFDQSAGKKEFKLPDPNPTGATKINIPGKFNGVDGQYICTPPADGSTNCGATVAESGFTLDGGTWMFEPTDPEARLMNVPDTTYASYGWWLHKSEDGKTYTASAFAANRGTGANVVPAASGITALRGTATYVGGAAGKYALSSTTGGDNDAGHFTADATLNADFNDDEVTGTINNFMGADGMARNWSVELKASTVSDTGGIAGDPETAGNTDAQMTVWTIDGTDGAAAGQWSGTLYENDSTSGVPQVATGTFLSQFGRDGVMVGAFGANEQ